MRLADKKLIKFKIKNSYEPFNWVAQISLP